MIHNTECNACVKAAACVMSALPRVCVLWARCTLTAVSEHAELKKEMGLQHVSGDFNRRKQEHNCLEYTGSRKCTTREGREDGEGEGDGWNRGWEKGIWYWSIASWDGEQSQAETFPSTSFPLAALYAQPFRWVVVKICTWKSCLLHGNSAAAVLSDHQKAFVVFGNRINTEVGSPSWTDPDFFW